MPLFEASPTGGGAHALSSYATGFWGVHDALHTFCEPSYTVTSLAAEPFNALGSFCYTAVGLINLWRLKSLGLPLAWRATCGWWSLVVVGLGSALFHTTMRYHMELLDEIPMLILVACGCLQCSDIHPLGKRYKWKGVTVLDLVLVGGLSLVTIVYLITRIFGLFITGFTVGTVFLLGIYLTADKNPAYDYLGGRAAIRIILARVAWELENHLCLQYPFLWPLHNVWHVGSCLAASDLFLHGFLYRVDRLGVRGIIAVAGKRADSSSKGAPVSSASLTPGRVTRSRAAREGIDATPKKLPLLLFCPESAASMVKDAEA